MLSWKGCVGGGVTPSEELQQIDIVVWPLSKTFCVKLHENICVDSNLNQIVRLRSIRVMV
jgi:hypothetical protein